MLRIEKGMCMISGDMFEVPAELITAIKGVRDALAEYIGRERADKAIYICGRIAYLEDEDIEEGLDELRKELLGE